VTPIVLQELNTDSYGLYVILMSIVSYLGLCNLGLPQTLVRMLSVEIIDGNKIKIDEIISSTIFYYFTIFIVTLTILFFLNFSFSISSTGFYKYSIVIFVITSTKLILEIFESILRSVNDYVTDRVILTVSNLSIGFISIYLLKIGYGLFEIMLIPIFTNLISLLFVF